MARCFRYVEDDEWEDISDCGMLRLGANSCGAGKWFARSEEAAWRWGEALDERYPSRVVVVEMDDAVVEGACLMDNLDNIGPAIYVGGDDLPQIQVVAAVERK